MGILFLMRRSTLQITSERKYRMIIVKHLPQDASKPTRNGFVHPYLMIETLIAASSAVTTMVTVSCTDINTLVDRAKVYPDLSVEERQEIIDLYYDFGEKYGLNCRDAKAD